MAFLIDQLNNSGLFAQSAYSACIATKDSDGNDITATYLTAHQDITNKLDTTAFSTVSGDFYPYSNPSGFITGVDLTPYQTTAGMTAYATTDDVANKLDTTAFSTVSGTFLTAHQDISATEWNDCYDTVETNSASWAGGGSVDTVPFIVQSPLTTGFSGTSAYIGLDGEAFESSAYVPVSSLTFENNYLTQISGKTISAYTARNAYTATYATTASRATNDINGNSITATYQPKLTIAGVDGTITAINNSAVGADVPSGFELVAGANISIVDDAQNSATTISVSGISAAEWNSNYDTVFANSATWGQGGTSYTGDAQGALDTVYGSSANWNQSTQVVTTNSSTWNSNVFTGVRTYTPEITGDGKNTELHIVSAQEWSDCYNRVAAASAYWPSTASMTGLEQAQYGVTTYYDVKSAVDAHKLVYCVTGNRMAFLAYSGTDNFEFQYYRSVGTHTDSQQGDQVFVYKIMNTNQWTTTVRNAFTKVIAGTGLSSTYTNGASGKIELSLDGSFVSNYATTGDLNYVSGVVGDVESLLAQL